MNDHFASWHLLYKPLGADIPSWPGLGGPGESLGHLGSESSLKFLRDRMNECLNACDDIHVPCKQAVNKPLPKRALDVREEKVRLCCTAGQSGNYCALSYRWGRPEETLRTTDGNINNMLGGIELSSLPKLLQDAVTLTHQLNVPYLWIDALCIIQENKQDWEAEAPKMGEYYKNAVLTIAASLANQVSQHILVPREEILQERLSNFDFTNSDGTTSQVVVRRVPDYGGIPLVANSPLSTRATLVPGRYLAGVWEQWLFSDMAWLPSWGAYNASPPVSKKQSEMPSWSWASIMGQVHFALETCVNSDKLSAIKLIHGDCDSTSGNTFMQPKENSSIVVEAPVYQVEVSSNDVLNVGQYEVNEKKDTWGVENIFKNRRKKSGTFNPDTVLLPDGQVTTNQGTFTSVRRSRKDEVTSPTALKTTVFCLHLGGGRYTHFW
ncbi:heterokaryon incompatibility protein [Fusarium langsethiae]|uniref:Heterokaryon incompatibility protein n=1 Tax=Fusarium langsethiae TaxID=179993 RepID=A0A0M9ES36_FUSLA|nr:heterokaryon incompatibility protein [Fusarium langsethiae]GKU05577.1 unnamed protein product [Fusarium langsethiae]GKU22467.1 unnamed protein product [Fusarium langsethiae]